MLKSTFKRPRIAALALALAGSAALGGCMTATPYQPATGYSANGYSDQQLEDDRFQVNFRGNSLTSRETVERYLLFRAAELTLQRGFDHFILVSKDTETRTTRYREPSAFGAGPWGYWSPSWRYYRRGFGWGYYNPFYDDPFWSRRDWDYRTVNQYEAMAEIVVGRGPKPRGNVRAFDAREVIDRLGPSIVTPTR
ncbi:CC0125/CC1285 family lipoprotein [Sphingomonas sp.]|jgi:hypothetical protein|uniref:CC0125/CC1285 family lipoprotein n=1 Tax=Sphingomonas sp. TaxID=28214 RepID=UPI002EDBB096